MYRLPCHGYPQASTVTLSSPHSTFHWYTNFMEHSLCLYRLSYNIYILHYYCILLSPSSWISCISHGLIILAAASFLVWDCLLLSSVQDNLTMLASCPEVIAMSLFCADKASVAVEVQFMNPEPSSSSSPSPCHLPADADTTGGNGTAMNWTSTSVEIDGPATRWCTIPNKIRLKMIISPL